jgi:hypothetical protein
MCLGWDEISELRIGSLRLTKNQDGVRVTALLDLKQEFAITAVLHDVQATVNLEVQFSDGTFSVGESEGMDITNTIMDVKLEVEKHCITHGDTLVPQPYGVFWQNLLLDNCLLQDEKTLFQYGILGRELMTLFFSFPTTERLIVDWRKRKGQQVWQAEDFTGVKCVHCQQCTEHPSHFLCGETYQAAEGFARQIVPCTTGRIRDSVNIA